MRAPPTLWRAPAKVNLTLHILGRRADGYHELDSLVVFAGLGDLLEFTPGETLGLDVEGPTAPSAGASEDNLVLRAARALGERVRDLKTGHFRLIKRLPVAAGLGGGSSDAAAALRALARANGLDENDPRVIDAARATGSDVPVCLIPRARMMRGIGDIVGPPLGLAPLPAVLVNPGVAVPTPQVFARLGFAKGEPTGLGASPEGIDAALLEGRNDMQAAAESLAPEIMEALALLARTEGVRLARMSGSGATCFAILQDRHAAARAARRMKAERPGWWSRATWLR